MTTVIQKQFIILGALTLLATPTLAEEPTLDPEDIGYLGAHVEEDSNAELAERLGLCDQPKPQGKPGEFIIYYAKDSNGNCVIQLEVK